MDQTSLMKDCGVCLLGLHLAISLKKLNIFVMLVTVHIFTYYLWNKTCLQGSKNVTSVTFTALNLNVNEYREHKEN